MSNYGLKISKPGYDVKTADDKHMIIHSKYETLKIENTGRLTVEAPEETLTMSLGGDSVHSSHVASYTHDLGYLPFYLPECNKINVRDDEGDELYVNDRRNETMLWAYSPSTWTLEYVQMYATTTQLTLAVCRDFNNCMAEPCEATFDAFTAYVDYTLFYNSMNAELNLL